MPKKIGLLTAGGDCQGLNATMRGLGKTLYQNIKDVELYGFLGGFSGMINADYVKLEPHDFSVSSHAEERSSDQADRASRQ